MTEPYHLSLALGRDLWNEIFRAALPYDLADGEFDVARDAIALVKQLQVRERVAGLLEDREPKAIHRVRRAAEKLWDDRKDQVFKLFNDLVRVEGGWNVALDGVGTEVRYGKQRVGADAYIKGQATGAIHLLGDNLTIPFKLERRVGASVALGDIRFDNSRDAVIGDVQDLALDLGDNVLMQLLARAAEWAVDQRIDSLEPVPVLPREQVGQMVAPMGGSLKMQVAVQDVRLEIDQDQMTLKVRFGMDRDQLTGKVND